MKKPKKAEGYYLHELPESTRKTRMKIDWQQKHPAPHVQPKDDNCSPSCQSLVHISPDIESDKFGYWPLQSLTGYHRVIPVIPLDVPRLLGRMD